MLHVTKRSFTLDLQQFTQLFSAAEVNDRALKTVFSVFDTAGRGKVDAYEVVVSLIFASAQLQRGDKLRGTGSCYLRQPITVPNTSLTVPSNGSTQPCSRSLTCPSTA